MKPRLRVPLIGIAIVALSLQTALAAYGFNAGRITWTLLGVLVIGAIGIALSIWRLLRDEKRLSESIRAIGSVRLPESSLAATRDLNGLQQEITQAAQRVRRQLQLLEGQLQQQRIMHQSMSTGMIALDLEQRIVSVNRAAETMFDLLEHAAIGRPLRELLHEPQLNLFLTESASSNTGASVEMTLHGHGKRNIHVIAERLCDGANENVGLLLLLQDVTRLRQLESIRSDFAANVSHELRTPITNIKGYVETLLESGTGDAQQAPKFLEIIKRNADRLALIIEDLLSLAELETPTAAQSLHRTPVPIQQIIESAVSNFRESIAERRIKLEIDVPAELVAAVDSELAATAIGNLLSNAIKYSRPTATVGIRCQQIENEIVISVKDEGPGISAEHLPRLFERFYRVDRARSRELGGTGLGLAIVKHIAIVHGGRVEVSSVLGRGSEFRIIVPQLNEPPALLHHSITTVNRCAHSHRTHDNDEPAP